MSELIKKQLEDAKVTMDKAIDHTESELSKIRAGKATPSMLDGLMVDYYGTPTPLSHRYGKHARCPYLGYSAMGKKLISGHRKVYYGI